MVGEYLVVEIEIPLALDQYGTGGRVEIPDRIDQPHAEGLLESQE